MKRKVRKITKRATVAHTIKMYPQAKEILIKKGIICSACDLPLSATIGESAYQHGVDADLLIDELNKAIKKGKA